MVRANKEEQRKAPILRFKGFTDDWEQRKLNEVTTRVLRKNKNLTSKRPLTISAQYGLIDQQAFFNKQVASSSLENYLLLEKGEFAYNKSYSNGFPYGTIKKLNLYDNGAVSTLYIAFKANIDINSDFLENLFSSNKWNNEVYKIAAEGARNHGLLNISPDDFFNIKITISKDSQEQVFISKFLRVFDNLLALYERKVKLLSQVKKYFLDNLFAEKECPNLRFKGFTDAWEQRKLGEVSELNGRIGFRGYTAKDIISKENGGILTFSPTNITNNSLEIKSSNTYITKEKYEESPEIQVNNGDILFVKTGSTLGKNTLVSGLMEPATINPQIVIIRSQKYGVQFLSVLLMTNYIQKQITAAKIGGAVPTLTESEIKKFIFYIPNDLNETEKIGQFFSKLDSLIALYEDKQQHLTEIKNTLLNTMFI